MQIDYPVVSEGGWSANWTPFARFLSRFLLSFSPLSIMRANESALSMPWATRVYSISVDIELSVRLRTIPKIQVDDALIREATASET